MKKLFAILIVLGSGNLQAAEDVTREPIRRISSSSAAPEGGFSTYRELMKRDSEKQQPISQEELTRARRASTHENDDGAELALELLRKNKNGFKDTSLRDDLSDSSDEEEEVFKDKPFIFTGGNPVYCSIAAALIDKGVFYIGKGESGLQRRAALQGFSLAKATKFKAKNEKVNPKVFIPVNEKVAPFRSQESTPVSWDRFKMVKSN